MLFVSAKIFAIVSTAFAVSAQESSLRRGHRDAKVEHATLESTSSTYKIALWGDLPYKGMSPDVFDAEDGYGLQYRALRDTVNNAGVEFAIHSGDVKGGHAPCGEISYRRFEDLANSFTVPMVFTVGDNGWTDCYRYDNGNYDPLERLQYMRNRFYESTGKVVLGQGDMHVTIPYRNYPEIQTFEYEGVMYMVGNVIGSNNGLYDGIGMDCDPLLSVIDTACINSNNEALQRIEVTKNIVESTFAQAKIKDSAAVFISIQANIFAGPCYGDEVNCTLAAPIRVTSGHQEFWDTLVRESNDFGKPVILFHGDFHYFQVYPNPGGVAPNLKAVMNPGSGSIGWILCEVDTSTEEVFTFTHIDNSA